jgi:hypothetical protein
MELITMNPPHNINELKVKNICKGTEEKGGRRHVLEGSGK